VDHEDFLRSFAATPGVVSLLDGLDQELAVGFVAHLFDLGLQNTQDEDGLRFLDALLDQLRTALAGSAAAPAPWAQLIGEGIADHEDDGYFVSKDRRFLFILADPAGAPGRLPSHRPAAQALPPR